MRIGDFTIRAFANGGERGLVIMLGLIALIGSGLIALAEISNFWEVGMRFQILMGIAGWLFTLLVVLGGVAIFAVCAFAVYAIAVWLFRRNRADGKFAAACVSYGREHVLAPAFTDGHWIAYESNGVTLSECLDCGFAIQHGNDEFAVAKRMTQHDIICTRRAPLLGVSNSKERGQSFDSMKN